MTTGADRDAWARDLASALDRLEPDERSALRLAYFEGLSCARIAERTGIPSAAVSRVLATAMRRVAGILEAQPGY